MSANVKVIAVDFPNSKPEAMARNIKENSVTESVYMI